MPELIANHDPEPEANPEDGRFAKRAVAVSVVFALLITAAVWVVLKGRGGLVARLAREAAYAEEYGRMETLLSHLEDWQEEDPRLTEKGKSNRFLVMIYRKFIICLLFPSISTNIGR